MVALDIKDMEIVYQHPTALVDVNTHYCPGCTHGVAHRLVAEVLDEMGIMEKTIGVASVGCSAFSYDYINTDFVGAPHGRAPAMATGVKRSRPDRIVFTYQGDGDMVSIGTGEIVAAAGRGENITVIFINNANFAMTGGQMAPTHTARHENNLITKWTRCRASRLPHPCERVVGQSGRCQLCRTPRPQ